MTADRSQQLMIHRPQGDTDKILIRGLMFSDPDIKMLARVLHQTARKIRDEEAQGD